MVYTKCILDFSAICQQMCQHQGVCVAPDRCSCSNGYAGNYCEEGEKNENHFENE